jgi:AcrR family transcriptional regulator
MKKIASVSVDQALAMDQPSKVAEAALALFLEHGYDATPMSMVARHTGLTKAGVYHHFESKEHLLYVVHKNHIERLLLPIIDEAARVTDPQERLRKFLGDYALLLTQHPSLQVLINETKSLSAEHSQEIRNAWRRGLHLVRDAITDLQKQKGCDSQLDPTYAAFAAIGMCSWICNWFDPSRPQSGPEVAQTMVAVFLHGLMPGKNPH